MKFQMLHTEYNLPKFSASWLGNALRKLLCLFLVVLLFFNDFIWLSPVLAEGLDTGKDRRTDGVSTTFESSTQYANLFTGSASYSIPIEVPQGPGGFTPSLALQYNSDRGNSWLGLGWDISGLPKIERSTKYGIPSYADLPCSEAFRYQDRFNLSLNNRNYELLWNNKQNSFVTNPYEHFKIEHTCGTNNNVINWKITDKSGVIYTFEGIPALGRVGYRYYPIKQAKDPNGNLIQYEYSYGKHGDYYPLRIVYGRHESDIKPGIPSGSNATALMISFETELRQVKSSKVEEVSDYKGGSDMIMNRRISKIILSVDAEKFQTFFLNYGATSRGYQSVLDEIKIQGTTGQPLKYQFNYQGQEPSEEGFKEIVSGLKGPKSPNLWPLKSDRVFFWPPNQQYGRLQNYGSLYPGVRWVDVNGDALADMVWGLDNRGWIPFNSGQPFNGWQGAVRIGAKALADKPLSWKSIENSLNKYSEPLEKVLVDNQGFPGPLAIWPHPLVNAGLAYYPKPNEGGFGGTEILDINQDGFVDIIHYLNGKNLTWINNKGKGWVLDSEWSIPKELVLANYSDALASPILNDAKIVDVNGDGYPDIVKAGSGAYLNKGFLGQKGWMNVVNPLWKPPVDHFGVKEKSSGETITYYKDLGVRYVDLNGDGLSDVLVNRPDRNGVINEAWINTGFLQKGTNTAYIKARQWKIPKNPFASNVFLTGGSVKGYHIGTQLLDINLDKLPDLIYSIELVGQRTTDRIVVFNTGNGWSNPLTEGWVKQIPIFAIPGYTGDTYQDNGVSFTDFNGDGAPDIGRSRSFYKGNVRKGEFSLVKSQVGIWLNQFKRPLLSQIITPLGGEITFDYTSSHAEHSYDEHNDTQGRHRMPTPKQVVKSIKVDDKVRSSGGSIATSFDYKKGYFDFDSREFRGFGEVTVQPIGSEVKAHQMKQTIYNFNQDDARKGKISTITKTRLDLSTTGGHNPIIYSRQNMFYNSRVVAKDYRGVSYETTLKRSNLTEFDKTQTKSKTRRVDYLYDRYANISEVNNYGDLKDPEDDIVFHVDYNYQTNNHILNLPSYLYVRSGGSFSKDKILKAQWQEYDRHGNLKKSIAWKGIRKANGDLSREDKNNPVTKFNYDNRGNILVITDAKGKQTKLTYDPTFPAAPVQITNPLGHTTKIDYYGIRRGSSVETDWYLGHFGQTRRITDPNGVSWSFVYNGQGWIRAIYSPDDGEPFETLYPSILYDYKLPDNPSQTAIGKVQISVRNEHLKSNTPLFTKFKDDLKYPPMDSEFFRRISVNQSKNFEKNFDENFLWSGDFLYPSGGPGSVSTWVIFLDGLGRPLETLDEANPETEMSIVNDISQFDGLGRLKTFYKPAFLKAPIYKNYGFNNKNIDLDLNYQIPKYNQPKVDIDYDGIGRIDKITAPDGTNTKYDYDLWSVTAINPNGHKKIFHYDAYDRLVKVEEILPSLKKSYVTIYDYDLLGNLIAIHDPSNNIISFEYNALGQKFKMTDPDMGSMGQKSWQYEYDLNGNLVEIIDAKDQHIRYEYDALNRPIKKRFIKISEVIIRFPGTSWKWKRKREEQAQPPIIWSYDDTKIGGAYAIGQLVKMEDSSGNTEYQYDKEGQIVRIKKTIDGKDYVVELTYDAMGRLTSILYPDKELVWYFYGRDNLLELVLGSKSELVSLDQYHDATGNLRCRVFGNTLKARYDYNDQPSGNQKLSGIKLGEDRSLPCPRQAEIPGGFTQLQQDLDYSSDSNGNIKQIEDGIDKQNSLGLKYDEVDRMKSATQGGVTDTYKFDDLGNIVEMRGKTHVYEKTGWAGPHAITKIYDADIYGTPKQDSVPPEKKFEYDANGNLSKIVDAKGNETKYGYDFDNQLISINDNSNFVYDGFGDRVKKVEGTNINLYPSPLYEVIDGNPISYYVADGEIVAKRNSKQKYPNNLLFYHPDHLGSLNVLSNRNGNIISQVDYYPYGQTRKETGKSFTGNYKFTGQELDSSGLYYFGARYYNPEIGKFITPDPLAANIRELGLGSSQTINPYSYVLNNPLNYVDSLGLDVENAPSSQPVNPEYETVVHGKRPDRPYVREDLEPTLSPLQEARANNYNSWRNKTPLYVGIVADLFGAGLKADFADFAAHLNSTAVTTHEQIDAFFFSIVGAPFVSIASAFGLAASFGGFRAQSPTQLTKASGETIQLAQSLGAAASRIPVRGGHFLALGSRIINIQKIATGRGIRQVKWLVRQYGGKAKNWIKKKGIADVEQRSGAIRKAEVHWYEAHGVGRVEFKVKRWLD